MSQQKIFYRYAKATYDLLTEEKQEKKFLDDISLIKKTFKQNQELTQMLNSVRITEEKKYSVLEKIFKNHFSSNITLKFIGFLTKKKRLVHLLMILQYIETFYSKNRKALILSAFKLDDETFKKISSFFEKKLNEKFEFEEKVDESLIGGFKVKITDVIYDFSLKNQLLKFKQKLKKQ